MNKILQEIFDTTELNKADELIREQQQGLGRPIITMKIQDQRLVVVGNALYNSNKWKTFPDFLSCYLSDKLGSVWINTEIAKPPSEQHTVLQWHNSYCDFQKKYNQLSTTNPVPSTGAVYCYIGLAYSLYLLEHNIKLPDNFINRIKDRKNFQGIFYELVIINCLIRAGFEITLENEADQTSKHCELVAVSKRTGKKYSVEVRMRGVEGLFGKSTDDGTKRPDPTSELTEHLRGAFKKPTKGERMIFIDVNAEPDKKGKQPSWFEKSLRRLKMREKDKPNDQAYLFITNIGFHRSLEQQINTVIFADGLNIIDFPKGGKLYRASELYLNKRKHIDVYDITEAFRTYTQLPLTFDGSLPSVTFGGNKRLIIGQQYIFEEENITGTVTAVTVGQDKVIYIAVHTDDNKNPIPMKKMTDSEYEDYKRHPEAYFGKIQHVPKQINDPFELFESFVKRNKNMSKEKLLQLMQNAPDIDVLSKMDHEALLLEYCERLVKGVISTQK